MSHQSLLRQLGSGIGLRFVVVFLLAFFTLQYLYSSARGSWIEMLLVDAMTVRPSAAIINAITPQEDVQTQGHRLVSPYARLNILNGCEGTESILLLISAIVAYRAGWRDKLKAMGLGTIIVYLLNQMRIVSLYYAAHYDRALFALLHGYVAPLLIIAIASLFFLWWSASVAVIHSHASTPLP